MHLCMVCVCVHALHSLWNKDGLCSSTHFDPFFYWQPEEVPAQIMTIKIEPKIIYRPKRWRVCVNICPCKSPAYIMC